jgi:single-strand DNA-binding protein
MSSNDVVMTITGNVVDEPQMKRVKGGSVLTTFRVASNSRRYDRDQQAFVDNTTLFVTISAWRGLAENVADSVHKGQPVVVTGRFTQRNYTVNEQPRSSYSLEASSVGHDLSRGVSSFTKMARSAVPAVVLDGAGDPADESEHWHDYEDEPGDLVADLERLETAPPAGDGGEYVGDPAARGLAFAS